MFSLQKRNGSGLLVDTALSMPKGDEDRPDFSLPVAALFDKFDRDSLLELVEKFPEIKFLIYAPDSGQVMVKIKYADCFLGFIYTKVFSELRLGCLF
jgi:hypothetical protein